MKPSGPILVAVTDTEASVRAIEHAAGFLAQPGDELLLVHVLYDGGSLLRWCTPRRSLARTTAFMQRRFAAALSRGAAAGVGHRMAVLRGEACCSRVSVAQALCLEARDVHARAVLLASDGRPSALGRIFGRKSLASQVARGASVPVIVAPPPRGGTKGGMNSAAASGHRQRVFLEAVSPRGGGSSIGAWRTGHPPPLQPQRSYNKLRDAGDDQGGAQGSWLWEHAGAKVAQLPLRSHGEGDAEASVAANGPSRSLRNNGEGDGQANCAEWTPPRPLSPERAAGPAQGSLPYPTLGEATVDAAARLRRAAEARRRAEAEAAPLGARRTPGSRGSSARSSHGGMAALQRRAQQPCGGGVLLPAASRFGVEGRSGSGDLTRPLVHASTRGTLPY